MTTLGPWKWHITDSMEWCSPYHTNYNTDHYYSYNNDYDHRQTLASNSSLNYYTMGGCRWREEGGHEVNDD